MDWKELLKAIRGAVAGLKLAEGKIGDVKVGEGDDAKSLEDLLGGLEEHLKTSDTAADGTAADVLRLTRENEALKASGSELETKIKGFGDVDARVASAEEKERKAIERATLAEQALRDSRITDAARERFESLGLTASQRKTAVALLKLDLEGVEVDGDKVSGLDAKISKLKKEHVDVFKPATKGTPGGDGGGDAGGVDGGVGDATDGNNGGAGDDTDAKYEKQLADAYGLPTDEAA